MSSRYSRYSEWPPYVPVAERRKQAEAVASKSAKRGEVLSPVTLGRGAIAKTFWGKAWCANLEQYSDFANRLPRGRSYARNGSVIDLKIAAGQVLAKVMGSRLYAVAIQISAVPSQQWQMIGKDCAGSIDSLVDLLQGRLSQGVMTRICKPQTGLFPAPKEIKLKCSCPDGAYMCKHVAAALYGVGARLDEQPELLFTLRAVDAKELVVHVDTRLVAAQPYGQGKKSNRILDSEALGDVFGIEMSEQVAPTKPLAAKKTVRNRAVVKKTAAKRAVAKKAVAKKAKSKHVTKHK